MRAKPRPPVPRAVTLERFERVQREHPGLTLQEYADLLDIKFGTLRAVVYDPDGSKQKKTRKNYEGTCALCGAVTKSDGTSQPSSFCTSCAHENQKIWTQEAVIDAIQRFAALNGRPPTALEWMHANPIENYPSCSNCHTREGAPFAKWADAIEAAGFPRPKVGDKVTIYGQGAAQMERTYVVFHRNGNGWESSGENIEAFSPEAAIEKAAIEEGEYAAILTRLFKVQEVKTQTRLGIVKS